MAPQLTPRCCCPTSRDYYRTQPDRRIDCSAYTAARAVAALVFGSRSFIRFRCQHSRLSIFGLGPRRLPGESQYFSCSLVGVLDWPAPSDSRGQHTCVKDHVSRIHRSMAHSHAARLDLLPRSRYRNLLAVLRRTSCDANPLVRHVDLATKDSSQPACVQNRTRFLWIGAGWMCLVQAIKTRITLQRIQCMPCAW